MGETEQFLWHDTIISVDPLHVPAIHGCHFLPRALLGSSSEKMLLCFRIALLYDKENHRCFAQSYVYLQ
jgi:hypothetical protein